MTARRTALVATLAVALTAPTLAQQKPALTRADYGQWESLSANPRTSLSPNGQWLAYGINRNNDHDDLRIVELASSDETVIEFGSRATFSSDSAWLAYATGYSPDEREAMEDREEPIQNRLGLRDLASGETTTFEGVESFSFSGDGRYLAMRRYRPSAGGGGGGGGRGGGAGGGAAPVGVTVIVRDLAAGRNTTFGNVGDYAWEASDSGHLLALTISAADEIGNGVHLYDPETTVLRVLDSATESYSGLTWRDDAADLTVLRSLEPEDDGRDGPTQVAIAWRDLGSSSESHVELDPTSAASFPSDRHVVTFRNPSWSDDGSMVFVGVAEWAEEPERPAGRGGRGGRGGQATQGGRAGGAGNGADDDDGTGDEAEPDEPADVAVWHWKDTTVMSAQQVRANADRRRNLLGVWHVDDARFVQIGQSFEESVSIPDGATSAYIEDWSKYAMPRSFGRRANDLYLADLSTGERTLLRENVHDSYSQRSPGGRYVLFLEDEHFWTLDTTTNAVTNLTSDIDSEFVNRESDSTAEPRPMFGVAGWLAGDEAVLLYDEHDIWQVAPDGSSAVQLTDGADDDLRHRLVRMDFDDPAIQPGDHYVSLFGYRSKQSGYGRITVGGDAGVERLMLEDASITNLGKAADADVYGWIGQRHDDSPDLFLSSTADLSAGRQITRTNAFQDDYAWSRSEVVDYESEAGRDLQGALYYPAGYQPGQRYPMIVYVYERLSDEVHRYVNPSETSYYNTTVFTSNGYFVLRPDIHFRPREPGLSVVESVRPAVEKVVEMGLADASQVGMIGHSWGGFDTAFMAAHTDTFAAAVAGAAITNLVSNYGNGHWSSGIAETDHIETGQQRMVVPLYEDLDAYIRNSAVYNVHEMTTPLMLMTGDDDGTVFWHQAVEMYNIGRRAGSPVVMLVYAGEDHSLRQRKNQVDYQQRILAWFGHHLKGEDGPAWITDGQTFLERQEEVRRGGGGSR